MMIINGKQIAQDIKETLKFQIGNLSKVPQLDIVYAGQDPAIESFMKMKVRFGEEIGVKTIIHRFPSTVAQETLIQEIKKIAADENSTGMIVQLPLPQGIDVDEVVNTIPPEKDADVLSAKANELYMSGQSLKAPPVAGAVLEVFERSGVAILGRKAVVIGKGRLVGKPVAECLRKAGAEVTVLDSKTEDITPYLLNADIVVSGVGKAHMIKPEMLKKNTMLIDAGSAEESGKIVGDADPRCAEKCFAFTPVPGGIGPMTVAILFWNLLSDSI
jgi:methylenetetrahydrofolate dehydrogenase (NADP+)/methenyltetrahydrofolate cyclohydrolase